MTVVWINHDDLGMAPGRPMFPTLWDHYLASGFLYPAKLERLSAALALILTGWPRLMTAPANVFQLHAASEAGAIVSSVCAFRDGDETNVIQHGASVGRPLATIQCIISFISGLARDPSAQFTTMYFRPENRWPCKIVRSIGERLPPSLVQTATRDYLIARPPWPSRVPATETCVEVIGDESASEILQLAIASIGPLRAAALGIGRWPLTLSLLDSHYQKIGLSRSRVIVGARRHGELVGVALCHESSIPLNFSFLCGRVEILVPPQTPARAAVVRDLAGAALKCAALRNTPACALLIDPADAPAAGEGGFESTGKRYANVVWARECAAGWPTAIEALQRLYHIAAGVDMSLVARNPSKHLVEVLGAARRASFR
jgi:hypothetical protein